MILHAIKRKGYGILRIEEVTNHIGYFNPFVYQTQQTE